MSSFNLFQVTLSLFLIGIFGCKPRSFNGDMNGGESANTQAAYHPSGFSKLTIVRNSAYTASGKDQKDGVFVTVTANPDPSLPSGIFEKVCLIDLENQQKMIFDPNLTYSCYSSYEQLKKENSQYQFDSQSLGRKTGKTHTADFSVDAFKFSCSAETNTKGHFICEVLPAQGNKTQSKCTDADKKRNFTWGQVAYRLSGGISMLCLSTLYTTTIEERCTNSEGKHVKIGERDGDHYCEMRDQGVHWKYRP